MRELNRSQKADVGYHNASVAIQNERLTRERVERLEETVRTHGFLLTNDGNIYAKLSRGFWGRLRWLLLGR